MAIVPLSVIATSGVLSALLPLFALFALSGFPPASSSVASVGALGDAFDGAATGATLAVALGSALGSAARAGRASAMTTIVPTRMAADRRRPVSAAIRVERSDLVIVGNPMSPRSANRSLRASPLNASSLATDKGHGGPRPARW